jgi:hypothetical protein
VIVPGAFVRACPGARFTSADSSSEADPSRFGEYRRDGGKSAGGAFARVIDQVRLTTQGKVVRAEVVWQGGARGELDLPKYMGVDSQSAGRTGPKCRTRRRETAGAPETNSMTGWSWRKLIFEGGNTELKESRCGVRRRRQSLYPRLGGRYGG